MGTKRPPRPCGPGGRSSHAGACEDLWADLHPGEYAFADNQAHEFFRKYL